MTDMTMSACGLAENHEKKISGKRDAIRPNRGRMDDSAPPLANPEFAFPASDSIFVVENPWTFNCYVWLVYAVSLSSRFRLQSEASIRG